MIEDRGREDYLRWIAGGCCCGRKGGGGRGERGNGNDSIDRTSLLLYFDEG